MRTARSSGRPGGVFTRHPPGARHPPGPDTRPDQASPRVYRDKGTPPKKGGGSSFTVTKLPSFLEPKGQRPLSLPHFP